MRLFVYYFNEGTKVRVDTSLVGFQNMHWVRGNRSVLFEVSGDHHMIVT